MPDPPGPCDACGGTGSRGRGQCGECAGGGVATDPRPAWLGEARKTLGLTQKEMGAALGMDSLTISRWERGENKPFSWTMLDLAIQQLAGRAA